MGVRTGTAALVASTGKRLADALEDETAPMLAAIAVPVSSSPVSHQRGSERRKQRGANSVVHSNCRLCGAEFM